MFKKIAVLLLCLFSVLAFSSCANQTAQGTADKVAVSVAFDAMKEFVQAVGGDRVAISTIIPDGTEPHDFEPKAKDLERLSTADVFVYNGFGMEAWADDAVQAANNKNLVVVEASKGAQAITNTDPGEIEEHGQFDPHIWISLKGAAAEAKNIRDGLVQADPSGKDYYNKNYDDFASRLETLYNQYNPKFQSAQNKSFVTGHAAFAYLCRDFGLNQNSVEDVFAEGEPSAQQLTELVDYCEKNHVTTIFAENMVSPEISQTLASEVGAKVETIYTIESSEGSMSYIDRMKANLEKIYASLSQ